MTRFLDRISRLFPLLAGFMFTGIMLVITREVVGRYFFDSPFVLMQDFATQLMLAATFWGACYVVAIRGFPSVDILYRRWSPRTQAVIDFVGCLGGLSFLVVLFSQITDLAIEAYTFKTRTTTTAFLLMAFPYTSMLFGLFFFILETCRQAVTAAAFFGRNLKRRSS